MKNGKKPTRMQRRLMSAFAKDTTDWLVVKDSTTMMECYNRVTGKAMVYDKQTEAWSEVQKLS